MTELLEFRLTEVNELDPGIVIAFEQCLNRAVSVNVPIYKGDV